MDKLSRERITVVIPLFNKKLSVEEAVRSVLNQTEQVNEIIVIDDGSTDGSADCLSWINDSRLRIIRQNNLGVSAARNRGIEEATGEIIAFLDADDRYMPNFIATILELTNVYPSAALFATSYRRFWSKSRIEENKLNKYVPNKTGLVSDYYRAWSQSSFFCSSSLAIRKVIFFDPIFRFPFDERLGEDQDLWFRISEKYPIAYNSKVHAEYRMGVDGSATQYKFVLKILPCYQRLSDRLTQGEVPRHMQQSARYLLAGHLLNVARSCLMNNDIRGAFKILLDSRTANRKIYRLRIFILMCMTALGFMGGQ